MADKDERKRLNYFNGLFLQAEDFQAEQDYHLEQQRRHNRLLHTPGIAGENSLTVTARVGETVITVSPGTAIDREGRQLVVLSEDQNRENIPVGTSTTPKRVLLVISYPPEPVPTSDPAPVGSGDTRVFERPILEVIPENDTKANQPTTYIQLARLSIGPTGIDAAPDLSVRLTAGVRAAGALVSVNGVSNPGGNVDLVAGGAIALTPNNTTKQITISENHSTKTDNPHKVTAAQVKALSTESGGTVNGVVNLVPSAGPVSMSILRGVPVNTPAPANNAAAFFYNTPPASPSLRPMGWYLGSLPVPPVVWERGLHFGVPPLLALQMQPTCMVFMPLLGRALTPSMLKELPGFQRLLTVTSLIPLSTPAVKD